MCGIVGYSGKNISKDLIERLVYESQIRGTHFIGRRGGETLHPKEMKGEMTGIIHTRYCTSGKTNQPLNIKGRLLAFNGCIHMGTKKEMEKAFNIKMETDNDGEIILQKCKTPEDVLKFLQTSKCSFAGLMLFGARFFAIRNERRPLWAHDMKNGVLIASTKDIFVRAGIKTKLIELKPLKIYEW